MGRVVLMQRAQGMPADVMEERGGRGGGGGAVW